jgi:hypothetical protein
MIFPVAASLIARSIEHPPTLQFPARAIGDLIKRVTGVPVETSTVNRGKWVLQYEHEWPSAVTPVPVWRFIAKRTLQ